MRSPGTIVFFVLLVILLTMTSAKGSAVRQSRRGVRASHAASSAHIPKARTMKKYFCQPPASLRKLKAAPVL